MDTGLLLHFTLNYKLLHVGATALMGKTDASPAWQDTPSENKHGSMLNRFQNLGVLKLS